MVKYYVKKRENNKFVILETMQFDNLFPRFAPKYQQVEEDQGLLFNSCLKLSVTYIFRQIIK